MICKCGTPGELKVFSTFQYYYCTSCKDEVQSLPKLASANSDFSLGIHPFVKSTAPNVSAAPTPGQATPPMPATPLHRLLCPMSLPSYVVSDSVTLSDLVEAVQFYELNLGNIPSMITVGVGTTLSVNLKGSITFNSIPIQYTFNLINVIIA